MGEEKRTFPFEKVKNQINKKEQQRNQISKDEKEGLISSRRALVKKAEMRRHYGHMQHHFDKAKKERQDINVERRSPTFYGKDKQKMTKTQREQVDLYDIILSHLLDEGYAETQEQAEVIMVNMSEEWREDIVEGYKERPVEKMKKKSMEIVDDPEYKGETGSVWRHQQILKHATKSAKSRETAKRKSQKNVDKYWEKEDR
jgi:hypothetical protein